MARISIGTSGWIYPHWRGPFYPSDLRLAERFAFYSARFPTVELNATFYRLPTPTTVAAWREAAPPGFTYAVKGSRFITHMKRLSDPASSLEAFARVLDGLGETAAVVLFQLPPRWRCNAERLAAFLAAFRARCGPRRVAFEFRDPSWYDAGILALLRRYQAAFCIYELGGHTSPVQVTADFVYLRLHGPAGKYAGTYGRSGLAPWVRRIRRWMDDGLDVFCYFDNDTQGAAPADATLLTELVQRRAVAE